VLERSGALLQHAHAVSFEGFAGSLAVVPPIVITQHGEYAERRVQSSQALRNGFGGDEHAPRDVVHLVVAGQ